MMDPAKVLIVKNAKCTSVVDTIAIIYINKFKTFPGAGSSIGEINTWDSIVCIGIRDRRIITSCIFFLFELLISRVPLLRECSGASQQAKDSNKIFHAGV